MLSLKLGLHSVSFLSVTILATLVFGALGFIVSGMVDPQQVKLSRHGNVTLHLADKPKHK